jgi:hypothetical protein
MSKSYDHLSAEERAQVYILKKSGVQVEESGKNSGVQRQLL